MSDNDRPDQAGDKKPSKAGHPDRRRGSAATGKSLPDEALDRLEKPVVVTEKGKRRKRPSRRVVVKRLMGRALRGDARARGQIIRLAAQGESNSPAVQQPTRPRWSPDRLKMYMEIMFGELVILKVCNLLRDADNKEQDEMRSRDRSTLPPPRPITLSGGSMEDRAIRDSEGDDRPDEAGERLPL